MRYLIANKIILLERSMDEGAFSDIEKIIHEAIEAGYSPQPLIVTPITGMNGNTIGFLYTQALVAIPEKVE